MEKTLNLSNGVLRLPPGFRFHPTDEELILQYLLKKALSSALPAAVISDAAVHRFNPWDLPGDLERERYYFSPKEPNNGKSSNRAAAAAVSGYWKSTGIDRRIVCSKTNRLVGLKRTFVFYTEKSINGSKTDWIMHEYRLADASPSAINGGSPCSLNQNWVLCRIFMKKRSRRERNKKNKDCRKSVDREFMSTRNETDLNSAPCSSSSESSALTEISVNNHQEQQEEQEEISSSWNSFRKSS